MKTVFYLLPLILITSCTPVKRAQVKVARAIVGSKTYKVDGSEVYCSMGPVCSEIVVLSVQKEEKDKGRVKVKLKNDTGNHAVLQIILEVIAENGDIITETRPNQVPIPPTQEKIFEMPGIMVKGASLRIKLNTIR